MSRKSALNVIHPLLLTMEDVLSRVASTLMIKDAINAGIPTLSQNLESVKLPTA